MSAATSDSPRQRPTGQLRLLQVELEQLYRLDPAPRVTEFLVEGSEGSREQLLILEEDELYLALALDAQALTSMAADALRPANLDPFCLAVEGLSHFLLVTDRARRDQPVTILELELQAEIDKFVTSRLLVNRCATLADDELPSRLYERCEIDNALGPAERLRYEQANTLARRYVQRLQQDFLHPRRVAEMLIELRRFYRMPFWDKQRWIHRE